MNQFIFEADFWAFCQVLFFYVILVAIEILKVHTDAKRLGQNLVFAQGACRYFHTYCKRRLAHRPMRASAPRHQARKHNFYKRQARSKRYRPCGKRRNGRHKRRHANIQSAILVSFNKRQPRYVGACHDPLRNVNRQPARHHRPPKLLKARLKPNRPRRKRQLPPLPQNHKPRPLRKPRGALFENKRLFEVVFEARRFPLKKRLRRQIKIFYGFPCGH